jgi:hypothetical protein
MPLSLQIASALVETRRNPYRRDDELLVYQRDLIAPFGVDLQERLFEESPNITFAELAEGVLRAAPAPLPAPDMIIVAYGLPDWYPFKTIASHLDHLLGGGSCCFAVSEQGLRAPFTALRIATAYARAGRCRTLALFVLEQSTFPYREPLAHDIPLVDSGVMLVFGEGGSYELHELWAGRPGQPLGELLRSAVRAVPEEDALLVAGPWAQTAELAAVARPCHRVAPGSYCTSVWLDLAHHHERWVERHPALVLCDTDPRSGRSQVAVLRTRATRRLREATWKT